jgi:hypothetical protein
VTDPLAKMVPPEVLAAPEQRSVVYPGNDGWLELEPSATAPSGDPAWVQIEQNATTPGADPAWLQVEH